MRFLSRSFIAPSVFAVILSVGAVSQAATYYVSQGGNDANNGLSPSSAWRSVNKVNTVNFAAGDSVLFEGGVTFTGKIFLDSSDRGNAASPVTISSYGNGRATIYGANDSAFSAYNTAGITLNNINFSGAGAYVNTKDGVGFFTDLPGNAKLAGITISNVKVSGFGVCGINIGSWNGQTGYRDIRITSVAAHDNAHAGISTYAQVASTHQNVYVAHCHAFNNFGNPRLTKNTGSGIVLGGVNGGTIERCVARDNGKYNYAPTEGPVGIWTYDSSNIKIQFNESHSNRTASGKDGGGFDLDINVQNSVMQYNYSHDNDGAGYLLCDSASNNGNVIRYNISQNDGRKNGYAAIHTYGNVSNIDIYNNTVFMSQTDGSPKALYLASAATNVRIRNNIFYSTGGARLLQIAGGQSGLAVQGNCYFAANGGFSIVHSGVNYATLDAWRNGIGQEKLNGSNSGIVVNPQLTAPGSGGTLNNAGALATMTAYKLQPGSPLIDRGLNLPALGTSIGSRDYYANSLPQGTALDIGAHERFATTAAKAWTPVNPNPTTTFDESTTRPIYFQHGTGAVAAWYMRGAEFVAGRQLRNGTPAGAGWTAFTMSDLNGDSSADVIFQHTDGRLAVWYMQGRNFMSAALLRNGTAPARGWRAVTMTDFNSDGKPDVLFQNPAGQLAVWQMNGTEFIGTTLLRNGQTPGADWKAVGARDFDGNGSADILFQQSNGALSLWRMNGTQFSTAQTLGNGAPPAHGWQLTSVTDLSATGKTDILWQHYDGRIAGWRINGTTFESGFNLRNGQPTAIGWRLFGPK